MKAFGIFEGGGAKGIAHIGALACAVERKVEFIGVAGASAGAVVAALVAAGYTHKELFDPDNEKSPALFHEDLLEYLDPKFWKRIKPLKDRLKGGIGLISSKRRILQHIVDPRNIPINWSIFRIGLRIFFKQGIFEADKLEEWIEDKLRTKISPHVIVPTMPTATPKMRTKGMSLFTGWAPGKPPPITFSDLPIPLSIVTTDITSRNLFVFSSTETPTFSVARAVVASLSLPFVFMPIPMVGRQLIDGGVLSNFPAWVFDRQRKERLEPTPTFGFRLHKTKPFDTTVVADPPRGIVRFFDNLFATIFSGDNILEVCEIEDLNLIPIDVRASTLDFDMDYQDKRNLYLEGRDAANNFFNKYIGPKDPEEIEAVLDFLVSAIKQIVKTDDLHIRANVWLPTGNEERLRILYTYNMSQDADDRLTLNIEQGCVGRCWRDHKIVCADLSDLKESYEKVWQMNKYQQALVRSGLRSLVSVPVFDKDSFDSKKEWSENRIIGVLCVDSDDDLVDRFVRARDDESDELHKKLVGASMLLSSRICG